MNKIQIFKHEMFGEIRTMTNEKGETFFVGVDIAKALGYANTSKAIQQHVAPEDRGTLPIRGTAYETRAIFINESGLYSLILSSKLPQAKVFKHWVTSEALPQIRKTGGYIPTKDAEGRQLTDLEIVCLALKIQQKTIEERVFSGVRGESFFRGYEGTGVRGYENTSIDENSAKSHFSYPQPRRG